MKHTAKKILCTLLVMVMCLTVAPLSGFVDFGITASALADSGSCGENVTYTYDSSTGELVISGTGAMTNYYYNENGSPFYNSDIKSVVIEDGVTSIGSVAFDNCTSLKSVTIPDSVTTIGGRAFYRCNNLTSVTIPDSVTTIGGEAFYHCYKLTSVTIPDSVTTIGDHAFYHCNSLTSIVVDINNSAYSNDSRGVLFNKNKTMLIQYPTGNTGTSYTIPDSVTTIGERAFDGCYSLTSVTIPDSVTTIGVKAFLGCYRLTSVTIPDSVTTIGDHAFYHCDNLTSVTIPDSVTTIGDYAFDGCYSLTSIVVDINNSAYSNDSRGVLFNKNKTMLIQYPTGNTGTSYTIPDSVTTIGEWAFASCYSLTSVTIPDSVTTIGDYAFAYCASLTSVTIPDSVTTIGAHAFYGCDNLTDVYYGGTEAQWNSIIIEVGNECLTGATIHFLGEDLSPEEEVDNSFFGKITAFFTRIIEWFRNLFR